MEDNELKLLLEKYRTLWNLMKHKYIQKEYKNNIYGQGKLLKVLINNGGQMSQKDLVKELNISAPSLSELVNKCLKNDYVKKIKSKDDLRCSYIEIADKGIELLNNKKNEIKSDQAKLIFAALTKEELKNLDYLLEKIIKNIAEKEEQDNV